MENLNNNTIIKNISFDQKEILFNIMNLYNNGEPFEADMTYSIGAFYKDRANEKYHIDKPKYCMDVYPQTDGVIKITPFEKLPFADNSLSSIVIDLPFCISPKTCKSMTEKKDGSCIIANRFASWYPYMEGYENMYWWINEINRVLKDGGICVYKMQNTISGSLFHAYTQFSFIAAEDAGLYVIDEFILEAKARLISSGKYKKQMHARKYTSTFWVFQKNKKCAKKTNCLDILKHCKEEVIEGKQWELK